MCLKKPYLCNMEKTLFLFRGIPGSGKSTAASSLGLLTYEADQYFMVGGEYKFDVTKLKNAHKWCQDQVKLSMENGQPKIAVSNTFTQEWEMDVYYELAKQFGYKVVSMIVENRHDGKNIHNVPDEKLEMMKNRFEVKL